MEGRNDLPALEIVWKALIYKVLNGNLNFLNSDREWRK